MARWWTKKYNLPSNHELFQERTAFDLLVEYYEDYYEENPLEAHRNEDGNIQFMDTGDSLIDKWEDQIARGDTPDLNEAFTPDQLEKLDNLRKKGKSRGSLIQDSKPMFDTVKDAQKEQDNLNKQYYGKDFPSTFGD